MQGLMGRLRARSSNYEHFDHRPWVLEDLFDWGWIGPRAWVDLFDWAAAGGDPELGGGAPPIPPRHFGVVTYWLGLPGRFEGGPSIWKFSAP